MFMGASVRCYHFTPVKINPGTWTREREPLMAKADSLPYFVHHHEAPAPIEAL